MAYENEEPKNGLILLIGVGSIVTIGLSMVGLQSYFQDFRDSEQYRKLLGVESPAKIDHRAEMNRVLTTPAKYDQAGERVRIPIDDAMKLLAQRGRDGFPAIKIDPTTVGGISSASAAPATSAPPAGSGSAAPATSSPAPGPAPGHH